MRLLFFLLLFFAGSIWGDGAVAPLDAHSQECGPYLRLVMTKKAVTIGGRPAQVLGGGASNQGILAVHVDGRPVIYKLLEVSPQQFARQRAGVELGAVYGGPQLYSSGALIPKANGRVSGYYLELEHLFYGENAVTAKDLKNQLAPAISRTTFLELSRSLLQMMDDGVVPVDPDFIFTRDGRWRWIDTNYWQRGPLNSLIYQTMELAAWLGVHNVITFRDVFLGEIRLDHPEEAELFERAFDGVINDMLKSKSSGRNKDPLR